MKKPVEYIMPVGLFDRPDMFVFTDQVFIDRKPTFCAFANEAHDMTEAEVFAKYVAPPERRDRDCRPYLSRIIE